MFKQKTMDKEATDKVGELKKNTKGDKKMFQNKLTLVEQTIQKIIEKEQITMFNQTWFATTFRVVGEYFHNNFI